MSRLQTAVLAVALAVGLAVGYLSASPGAPSGSVLNLLVQVTPYLGAGASPVPLTWWIFKHNLVVTLTGAGFAILTRGWGGGVVIAWAGITFGTALRSQVSVPVVTICALEAASLLLAIYGLTTLVLHKAAWSRLVWLCAAAPPILLTAGAWVEAAYLLGRCC